MKNSSQGANILLPNRRESTVLFKVLKKSTEYGNKLICLDFDPKKFIQRKSKQTQALQQSSYGISNT